MKCPGVGLGLGLQGAGHWVAVQSREPGKTYRDQTHSILHPPSHLYLDLYPSLHQLPTPVPNAPGHASTPHALSLPMACRHAHHLSPPRPTLHIIQSPTCWPRVPKRLLQSESKPASHPALLFTAHAHAPCPHLSQEKRQGQLRSHGCSIDWACRAQLYRTAEGSTIELPKPCHHGCRDCRVRPSYVTCRMRAAAPALGGRKGCHPRLTPP